MSTSAKRNPFDFDVAKYPPLPRARGVFVTGTDTEVGKTLVAGAIARRLRRSGRRVEVFKPAATGCRRTREGLVSDDTEFLAACADSRMMLADITPVRYRTALAPNVAAEREGRPVDLEAIFQAYARVAVAGEVLVVEGVGGLLCPISNDFWVIHFARMTRLPLVIVARAGLGTINHTLLTLHAARSAGLSVAGVVINRYRLELPTEDRRLSIERPGAGEKGDRPVVDRQSSIDGPRSEGAGPRYARGDEDLAMFTNPVQIIERGRVEVLAIVPEEEGNSVQNVTVGRDTQFAIDQVDWERIIALER
jgi:dethiobiotin synthetase